MDGVPGLKLWRGRVFITSKALAVAVVIGRGIIVPYRADGARPDMLALPAGHPRIAATVAPGIPTASAISAIRLPSRRSMKIRSIWSRVACMLEVYARTPRNATFSPS